MWQLHCACCGVVESGDGGGVTVADGGNVVDEDVGGKNAVAEVVDDVVDAVVVDGWGRHQQWRYHCC